MPKDRVFPPYCAVLFWIIPCVVAALYGIRAHYGIRLWAGMLAAIMMLLAGEIWVASPAICRALQQMFGPRTSIVLTLWPLGAYLAYALGTRSLTPVSLGVATAYCFVPVLLTASASGKKPGAWQDYLALALIAVPVKMEWLRVMFPYPKFTLVYSAGILIAVNVSIVAFLFVRRVDRIGYFAGWQRGWFWAFAFPLVMIAAIDIPGGIALRFIRYAPRHANIGVVIGSFFGLLILTGLPEEFLFRGLLQNMLGTTFGNDEAGWIAASVIFGFSHIATAGPFPNWKYVLLATIAGLFYGYAWRKSKSLFPGALVHACVDWLWFLLFRTL